MIAYQFSSRRKILEAYKKQKDMQYYVIAWFITFLMKGLN